MIGTNRTKPPPMSKKQEYVQKLSDARTNHLFKENKDQLGALLKFGLAIRKDYREIKAAEGVTAALMCGYKTIETALAHAFAESPHTISCIGCTAAHCCHQNVEITETEAAVIGQFCREQKITIPRQYLREQLTYGRENISSADCSACVFLKDNKCGIYPVRPVNCRIHNVVGPIENCDTKNNKGAVVATLPVTAAEMIGSVLFEEGGKTGRLPKMMIKYSQ